MGKPAARLGDIGSDHTCHFPATPAVEGSPNVFINGRPAVREGDAFAPHGCIPDKIPPHPRKLAKGASTVFINGKHAGRIDDPVDCGGKVVVGSPNVFIGEICLTRMAADSTPFVVM